jgi:GNAT superfamily N-acetyltransferase
VQLELKLDEPPTISGRVPLRFTWERFGAISHECLPLFRRHYKEVANFQDKVPFDPDWERYFTYDLADVLNVLTVRDDKTLVGYAFVMVHPHPHYVSTLWAICDLFWLDPAYRFGWTGVNMFREVERHARERGVKVMQWGIKLNFEPDRGTIAKLFIRLGYTPTEMTVSKYLE